METLEIQPRSEVKKQLSSVRASGLVPAVFYSKDEPTTNIAVREVDFLRVWETAGESSVITLATKAGEKKEALIHAVDVHPVTGDPRHADFLIIKKGQAVTVYVPLEFIGVAPAVKDMGGTLVKVMHEVEIEAPASKLPHQIEIDITSLVDFDAQITAGDIVLPEGVTLKADPLEVVALVSEAQEETEEDTAAPDLSAIEVEKKGSKEEAKDTEST